MECFDRSSEWGNKEWIDGAIYGPFPRRGKNRPHSLPVITATANSPNAALRPLTICRTVSCQNRTATVAAAAATGSGGSSNGRPSPAPAATPLG